MRKYYLTPVERVVAKSCKNKRDALKVIKEARRKIDDPDYISRNMTGFNLLRLTILVGFVKNPGLYIYMGLLSLFCYLYLIYSTLRKLF